MELDEAVFILIVIFVPIVASLLMLLIVIVLSWVYNRHKVEDIVLTEAEFKYFRKILDNPPPPNEKLIEAAKRYHQESSDED